MVCPATMILKAKLLVLYNTLLSIPITLYLLGWFFIALAAFARADSRASLIAALTMGLIFLFVSSIYTAVRLKVRILKDLGDPGLAPTKAIYKSASRINIGAYAVYYPLFLSLLSPTGGFLGVPAAVFTSIVLIAALPLRWMISRRARTYDYLRYAYALGQYSCPKCRVSVGLVGTPPRWSCFRCGAVF